jgi:predicted transcriptional regulator
MDYKNLVSKLEEEIDYINRPQYRLKVLKSLDGEVKIPSEIANDTEIFQNHISNTLRQLKEHELVECINPEVRKGRLYRLTDNGEEIIDKL